MIFKFILLLICSLSGYFIVLNYYGFPPSIIGLFLGLLIALLVMRIEHVIRQISLRTILGGVVGMFVGLFIAFLLAYGLSSVSNIRGERQVVPWIYALLTCTMSYLGLVVGSRKIEEFPALNFGRSVEAGDCKILDTSIAIDGRIADICDTGFIEGKLIVPRFVLNELQHIADSSDTMKRSRGRRGLDILNRMQKSGDVSIEIIDQDFPKIKGVDAKLVALAKEKNGKIITNDYNLNKVAELQGVKILSVHELANALKPVVLPGEVMAVKIIKEGKESGQGVAYLEDGTMIVVDDAQQYQGTNVEIMVTSVLQTTAGRMIFAELKDIVPEKKAHVLDYRQ
ncbi:MAG: PIN domain-containing protein [Syntrophales bacterium]